jgi:hypothetical protein
MIRAMRLLNAIEAGTTSGAQLQTLIAADPGRLAELNVLLGMRGQARRMAASSTAMDAVIASSTAMAAVAASSTAMAAVAASSTAMTAVAASNTASDAVFTSATARLAIYNSDIALSAFQANPTQVQRQIDTAGRTTSRSTAASAFTYVANGTKVILLRCWTTGGAEDLSLRWGRGLTTDDVAGGIRLPNGDNLGVATAALGRTTTYANSGTYPGANNANANVVSAANGLRRGIWSIVGSTTQNVIYITV